MYGAMRQGRALAVFVAVVAGAAIMVPSAAGANAAAPTGCQPTACTPGTDVGLTTVNSKGQTVPAPGAAGLYGWGAATEPDGSVLLGDYWNYRIVHYNDNEVTGSPTVPATPASPYVFSQSRLGYGPNTNQAPFGICVDTNPSSAEFGHVYMTEGSMYAVNAYDASGNWLTSWGTKQTKAVTDVNFTYPSQCAVGSNGLVYISNQWGRTLAILDPTNATPVQFVTPPSPNTFIQPRGLAFDSAGNLWVADEGHKRIDIFYASAGLKLNSAPNKKIPAPPCSPSVPTCTTTTFDMRGLAIDTSNNLAFVANGQGCVVQEFNANPSSPDFGKFVTNFNGVPAGGSDCGTGNGQFEDGARDIAVDGSHNVWVGDLGGFRAQVFDESGNFLFAVPNPASPPPVGGFNGPRGVAFDGSGNMYVTDTYNERIEEFSPNGSGGYVFEQQWGMRGDTVQTFNYPRLLCWDPLTRAKNGDVGALVVANTDSNAIVAWDTTSTPSVVWGTFSGTPPQGTLLDPYGVACDPSTGYIYVGNSNGKDVVVYDSAGNQLGTIGLGVIAGFVRGIAVDPVDGSVWVDDGAPGDIYHFGSWASGGAKIGTPIAAGKNSQPFGIAADSGYVYVALSAINQVAEYNRAGTLLGTFGGFGTSHSTMQTPQGLSFGPDGKLYIVEEGNNRVSQWSVP